jgi:hypothetical protein
MQQPFLNSANADATMRGCEFAASGRASLKAQICNQVLHIAFVRTPASCVSFSVVGGETNGCACPARKGCAFEQTTVLAMLPTNASNFVGCSFQFVIRSSESPTHTA